MSNHHKRKFGEYHHDAHGSSDAQDYQGVGQLLAELKKPSPHKPSLPGVSNEKNDHPDNLQHETNILPSGIDEWQRVGRKSKNKTRRKRAGDEKDRVKYPELICHIKNTSPIRLANLQALILYTLADGVAPNWLAFKHAHHTRKVVVLMVPGLEEGMFDRFSFVKHNSDLESNDYPSQKYQEKASLLSLEPRLIAFDTWKNSEYARTILRNDIPMELDARFLPQALQPLMEMFKEVWPVKSPGDSRYSRLHSPIQAILISPLAKTKEHKAIKGPKPPIEESVWRSQRTPIIEFVHSAEELREAEYPLHPAVFDGDVEAGSLEQERRNKTSQNAEGGWMDTRVLQYLDCSVPSISVEQGSITAGRTVYALDCEMVLTSDDKYSLARISIVDWNGKTILDELVKPSLPIKNYFTQFSGMTSTILDPVKTTLSEIQSKLLDLFTPQTIILGHSLESDLTAMKLTHPFVVDTSLIYPHPRGPPLRSSLKFLAQKYLRRDIQQQDATGHNSVEDALAVLDLVKLKCEKGPKWGTSDAAGEPIFRRLARNMKKDASGIERNITSAIVDYGTPERGYGKEATVQIGCGSDEEIVKAMTRAANGDADGKVVPGGGVDFTWGRLRELESFRGWWSNNRDYSTVDKLHEGQPTQPPAPEAAKDEEQSSSDEASLDQGSTVQPEPVTSPSSKEPSMTIEKQPSPSPSPTPTLHSTLAATVSHIRAIHDALPPCTLFIVYSGTGDPREVGRLQKMQQQFRKEFKVKKWDELSVKWTDDEEQALRRAVERARGGIAFLCVK
jgi:RNA exonuclease 1